MIVDTKSQEIRLTFEQAGTILILVVLGIGSALCVVSLWPAGWATILAAHLNAIANTLISFVGALAGVLGLSWGRGHMDARLERQDNDAPGT
jgi:hypothetical protein